MSSRTRPSRAPLEQALGLAVAVFVAGSAWLVASEPVGRAIWCACVAVLMLPVAYRGTPREVDWFSYLIAGGVSALACGFAAGPLAALVVGAVAFSLLGLLLLYVRIGVTTSLAISLLLVQGVLFFTWPIWAAQWLVRFDVQWLVDLLVKIGPLFAINGAIDPTDPLTHRPLAYRLMNLGQDIPYAMPTSVWPCVIVHVIVGLPGIALLARQRGTAPATSPLPA